MDLVRAREILGVRYDADASTLRAAYLEVVRHVHPDVCQEEDAAIRTSEATEAYRSLLDANHIPAETTQRVKERVRQQKPDPRDQQRKSRGTAGSRPVTRLKPRKVDGQTISLGASISEVYPIVVELGHEVGDVTYVEPNTGIVQTLVQFVESPPCYVQMTAIQEDPASTEIHLGIESLNSTEPPPLEAVTDLLMSRIRALKW